MKPEQYQIIDNELITDIFQVRNDGQINYNLTLKIDINKHLNGNNIIDCLILDEMPIATAFTSLDEDYYYGNSLYIP